ncbi:chromosome transmission fidelity protein 18 homolog isoform X2 [Ptychodera flava]|uniref:chromosome transmission fidelity protein 18 homolog isoform X2 n=1 Tax=Ptychodera flava TaxID=63121 RepID=UPI003969DBA4
MASFDPGLEDPYDDFEQQYADELELMNEMEDFEIPDVNAAPISKKTLHFTTPKQKQFSASVESSPLPVMSELESPDLGSKVDIKSPPLTNGEDVEQLQSCGDTPTGRTVSDKFQQPRLSQKRNKNNSDLYGLDSDSDGDGDLIIDAPFLSPRRKKPRINKKVDNRSPDRSGDNDNEFDDFQITPPPSPDANEKMVIKIQQHRKQTVNNFTVNTEEPLVRADADLLPRRQNCLLSREPNCPFVTVTGSDGKRMYLRMKDDDDDINRKKKSNYKDVIGSERSYNLLSTSISELKEIVDDERRSKVLAESERISDQLNRKLDEIFEGNSEEEDDDGIAKDHGKTKAVLWVEKYTPKHYTELLSDDGTNRTLLHWLKLWDHVVFGKEKKAKPRNPPEQKKQNKFQKKWQQDNVFEELDDQDRPVQKVALLCGPPGLGKTTLAHIIAQHAGYNVVEMNASDDRSADVFRTTIESATQMKSVLSGDQNAKPNCLVIDEIDGAPAPAINVLLSVTKKQDGRNEQGKPGRRRKKDNFVLSRPIICICNDQYVPALRQLRQQAIVINFPPTLPTRLASRLLEIAKNNCLQTDQTTLLALCSKADNDIRSCINTLQFVHGRHKQFTLTLVRSMSIGQKDQHKGLFTVWQEIFSLPKAKRKRYKNPHEVAQGGGVVAEASEPENATTLTARFNNVYSTVSSNGEYEKLTQGLFDNFLDLKFKDPHLEAVVLGHDWLAFNDHLNQQINHSQSYNLMKYLPYMPVAFHMLFASSTHHRIQYPNTQYENTVKLNKTTNLLESMLDGVSALTKRNVNTSIAALDLLPFLIEIVQPNIRPVNTQLFSGKEKDQLATVVSTMIAYNLTYHQARSQDGQYNYVLEPNVEEVIKFSGSGPKKQMTYATKQLIAREIGLEKMRRTYKALSAQDTPKKKTASDDKVKDKGKKPVPRHKEKLEAKKITLRDEKPVQDFFGRVIEAAPKSNTDESNEGGAEEAHAANVIKNTLWYKFKEGYTNAIRRQVRIQDLL